MGGKGSRVFVCPFYVRSERLCVRCEGCSRVSFTAIRQADRYFEKYCKSHDWEKCTIAESLLVEYEAIEADKKGKIIREKEKQRREKKT